MDKVNKHYVSSIDEKLETFNRNQPRSDSQKAEIKKYERIYQQRDHAETPSESQGDIWGDEE